MRRSRLHSLGHLDWGYSLVELAVAMGVFSIIAVIVGAVLVSTITYTRRGAAGTEAQQLARLALSQMTQELRETRGGPDAVAVWPAGGEPFDAIGFVSARQDVAGRPFGTDGNGSPIWRTAVYYVFDRGRGELRRIARPWDGPLAVPAEDTGRVVARGVRDVSVSREHDMVRITMDVLAGRGTVRLETAIFPRN